MRTLLPRAEFDSLKSYDRNRIREYCSRCNKDLYGMFAKFNAGPDEQLITWMYFGKWTNISRQFCGLPWLVHRFR